MRDLLDLQRANAWPGSTSSLAVNSDEMPLPAEFDTRVLERTAQLQKRNEELEAFSYSVCHDLTAPLQQIQAYLGLLRQRRGEKLDELTNNYLAAIQRCTERMARLTQDLLRLSNISRYQLLRQRTDLSKTAQEIASNLSAGAPERRVEWLIHPDLHAEADPGLVEILLQNLFSNAWKYTLGRSPARIEFGCLPPTKGTVVYQLRDNGAGFNMALAERLFQPFERLHTQEEFPGIGLGLATARRIVQCHEGRIWADGAVGSGAVFRFTLGPESGLKRH